MNKNQTNHFDMLRNVQSFLSENSSECSAIPRILTYKDKLDENITKLGEKTSNSIDSISVSGKKDKLKEEIAIKGSVLSGTLTAFAHEKGDTDMAKKVNFSKSSIHKLKENELVPTIKFLVSVAREYINDLADFGLTGATLETLDGMANEYNELVGKPRSIQNKKFVSQGEVEQLLTDANNLLRNQLDKLMLAFRESNPAFYDGYHRARVIVDR